MEHLFEKRKKACAAAAALITAHHLAVVRTTSTVVSLCASKLCIARERKKCGRYKRHGAIPPPEESIWARVDCVQVSDEMEFFMFLGLSRESFAELVQICERRVEENPLDRDCGKPTRGALKRRSYGPRGIMAMAIKWLSSCAEPKDLYPQFGVTSVVFRKSVELGLLSIVGNMNHPKMRVIWDRSIENMEKMAARTAAFLDIPGVVGMIDGRKMPSLHPDDFLSQNRDYNGWTKEVNRNVVLLWDPFGKIVDAVINCPGNFHDSKSTLWGNMYDHIIAMPEGYIVVCDSAFETRGELKGKLLKLKGDNEGFAETPYEMALTHLRQSSEWGNGVLVNAWRRLRAPLPTDNTKRALLMWSCVLMHNYRTETCDRNQIKTYFDNINKI